MPKPGLLIRIFLPYCAGYFLSYLLRTVNAVMAPELSQSLGITASQLGLLTASYLGAFALAQLPLGICLDRFGPRRVQAALLVVTAIGCAGFALGRDVADLFLARSIIGIGVSACLMAAYKAYSQWFPPGRLASLNAATMVAGGLGALTSSSPFSALLPWIGWRWIFAGLALFALIAAAAVRRSPDKPVAGSDRGLLEQLGSLKTIFGSRSFWRFAPIIGMMNGGFTAIQGLWAMPWLTEVAGVDRGTAAYYLLVLNVALMVGYSMVATQIGRLVRRGIMLGHVLVVGGFALQAVSLTLVTRLASGWLPWALLGLFYATTNLSYADHASRYPLAASGRANTCLNLAMFVCSFFLQWGFGVIVDAAHARGLDEPAALQFAWGLLLSLQVVSMAWFALSGKWERSGSRLLVSRRPAPALPDRQSG